jgi:hypothetical protein
MAKELKRDRRNSAACSATKRSTSGHLPARCLRDQDVLTGRGAVDKTGESGLCVAEVHDFGQSRTGVTKG